MKHTLIDLYQPKNGVLNVPYQPDETSKLIENPPRFTWMPAKLDDDVYVLEISTSENFEENFTKTYQPIDVNFLTPDQALPAGTYYWRYALLDEQDHETRISKWSKERSFVVKEDLPDTPLPSRENRYKKMTVGRPRLWLSDQEVVNFRAKIKQQPDFCQWSTFIQKSVEPYLQLPLISEPAPYPNNHRVAKLWRQMYMDCQEALYAVRHLSVAGIVLEDHETITKAKEWLLHVSSWDTEGATSRDYNDEAAFRIAGALAWGYDWLHGYLSDEEREYVRTKLFRRTEQVAFHVMERSKIHHVPYDSHAVRSLSSVLVPCCIALFDEVPEARVWLDYTLEYYSGIYTPWGGEDGGWAEGPHYWMTGMAYVIDALNLIKKFNGLDYYKRPFFQKTGDFPLFVYSPDTRRASFGDIASLGELTALKVGYNIRQFAGVTGNPYYQWFYEQTKKYNIGTEGEFYNKGWWDFYFDDIMYLHDFPLVEAKSPTDVPKVKWFQDVGWVAMHHRMDEPAEHIMYVTKSSRYGSISHSHGDQNAFLLHAFGEPLAIHSGYYVAFNSTMHMKWRRQTISKNAILIDGKGQFAEKDKFLGMEANGDIEIVEDHEDYAYVRADATNAYKYFVPYLKKYCRETYFVNNSYFILVDTIDLDEPGTVDWLIHSENEMKLKHQSFLIEGDVAALEGKFVYCSSGELDIMQYNDFPDVDQNEIEGMPIHWRLQARTTKAKRHRIVTLLHPMKQQQPKYVSYFMDDQDHGLQFYFTESNKTFRIEVAKLY